MTNNQVYENAILRSAIRYAKEAGQLIVKRMSETHHIQDKVNHADLVTEVDVSSEQLIRQRIGEEYPEHWILSEETDGELDSFAMMKRPSSGYGWIIDPIDGTINFIHGIPHFSVSIGIMKEGSLLHGVVYNPVNREMFHATKDGGAYLNRKRIRVRTDQELDDALLATGFQASDWRRGSIALSQADRAAGVSRSVRIFGAASLDLCMVASGRLTGFWHDGLYPWDVAAGLLIVREAGGTVTNASGEPYAMSDKTLIASNPRLQHALLALLNENSSISGFTQA